MRLTPLVPAYVCLSLGLVPSSARLRSPRPRTLQDSWTAQEQVTPLSSPSANLRAFYPRMFTATPSTGALNTPWFLDYGHLVFWFFFFATFVLVLWLAYTAVALMLFVEPRRPVRETRGFSRAQTGDALTAVLPMTWSITMLMHASTHSTNFDENTAATQLTVTVMAYQWGWNYYLPRDVVGTLNANPLIVGRGHSAQLSAASTYASWLEQLRADYALRLTNAGRFAHRSGQLSAPNTLALGGLVLQAPVLVPQVTPALKHAALRDGGAAVDAAAVATLRAVVVAGHTAGLAWVNTSSDSVAFFTPLAHAAASEARSTTRGVHTAGLLGNRLGRVHGHLASATQLPSRVRVTFTQANKLRGWLTQTPVSVSSLNLKNVGVNLGFGVFMGAQVSTPWAGAVAALQSSAKPVLATQLVSLAAFTAPTLPSTGVTAPMLAARVFAYGAELTPAASAVFLAPEDRATNVSAALANAQLMLSAAQTALLLNPWSDTTPTLARANLLSWPFAAFGFAGVKPAEVVAGSYARSTAATLVQGGEPRRTATSSLPSSVGTDTKHAVIFTTPVDASLLWDAPARFPVFFGPRFSADVLSSTAGVVLTKTSAVSLHATRLTLAPLSWLAAADETRPLLASTSLLDNETVGVRGAGLALIKHPLLQAWERAWLAQTAQYAYPTDRQVRGSFVRRPWGHVWTGSLESSLTRTAAPVLDKNETGVVTGFTLGVQRRLPWFPELAAPVLDGEWGILARVPAVLTPAPYADLDLGFVHQRWAFEVNTTRRSDHDARYRLTWGPAVSALAQPEAELTATTYGQQTGPAGLRALTPTSLTRLPLLVQTELRFKADAGHLAGWPTYAQLRFVRAASGESALAGAVVPLALGGTRALRYAELLRPRTGGLRASRHELTTSRLRAYWTSPSGFKAVALNVRDALVGARGSRRGVVTLPTTARAGELAASRLDAAKRGGFTRAREDVASLRRLRVTKGFSLPSDLPVHVICGSKDVIHSWAIPGLNVKIDCIPGYNSHRRVLLRWRGLFWGQCMEVCGRYHHWMPILVQVVHRDQFLSWCLVYLRAVDTRAFVASRTASVYASQHLLAAVN